MLNLLGEELVAYERPPLPKKPRTGLHSELCWRGEDDLRYPRPLFRCGRWWGCWDVRLTVSGRRIVREYLEKYPAPQVILTASPSGRRLLAAAKAAGKTDEEITSAAMLGVMNAARLFMEGHNTKFPTYVYIHVYAAVQREFDVRRVEVRKYRFISLNWVSRDGENFPEPAANEGEQQDDIVMELLQCLDRRKQFVVMRYYGLGGCVPLSYKQIANQCRISKERVRQLLNEAIDTIRDRYERHHKARQELVGVFR